MTPTLDTLFELAWRDATFVGTSCVDLDAQTILDAIRLGGPGGTLYLSKRQAADLGNPPTVHGATVVVGAYERTMNAGADWMGLYVGPDAQVGICSRAGEGRFGWKL